MKEKSDKHVDRVVRFRRSFENPDIVVPPAGDMVYQDLIMISLWFEYPEGGIAGGFPDLRDLIMIPLAFEYPEGATVE